MRLSGWVAFCFPQILRETFSWLYYMYYTILYVLHHFLSWPLQLLVIKEKHMLLLDEVPNKQSCVCRPSATTRHIYNFAYVAYSRSQVNFGSSKLEWLVFKQSLVKNKDTSIPLPAEDTNISCRCLFCFLNVHQVLQFTIKLLLPEVIFLKL